MPGLSRRARLRRDLRMAPWADAVPIALIAIAGFTLAMVVADLGGWGLAWTDGRSSYWTTTLLQPGMEPGDVPMPDMLPGKEQSYWTAYAPLSDNDGLDITGSTLGIDVEAQLPRAFVVLCVLLAVAAAWGRRWLSLALTVALGLAVALWVSNDRHLGYTSFEVGGDAVTAVALSSVVGSLLAVATVVALPWAIRGRRAPRPRPRWDRALPLAALWGAAVLTAPRAGKLLADGAAALGATESSYGSPQGIVLLFVTIGVVYSTALLALRARPAVALAATIVGAALWLPLVWMSNGFGLFGVLPGADSAGWPLAWWGIWLALGLAGGVRIAVAAGRSQQARSPGAYPAT